MAVVSQAVVVRIHIERGTADADVQAIGDKGVKAFGSLSRIIGTVSKALLSMVAVLAAFNLFVTLPEMMARGFFNLSKAMIQATAEMEQSILSIAGLLTSFGKFADNLTDSFKIAQVAGEQVMIMMTRSAAQTLATTEDLMLVFQRLVAGGAGDYVQSLEEMVKLSVVMADIVLAIAGGQNKQKQLVSETDAVMQAEARSGALVARILKSQVGDLEAYMEKRRQEKDLLKDIEARFGGIVMSAREQNQTLSGLFTGIVDSLRIINFEVTRFGAAKFIKEMLQGWFATLSSIVQELFSSNVKTRELSDNAKMVLNVVTGINVSIMELISGFGALVGAIFGGRDALEGMNNAAYTLLTTTSAIRTLLEQAAATIRELSNPSQNGLRDAFDAGNTIKRIQKLLEITSEFRKGGIEARNTLNDIFQTVQVSPDFAQKAEVLQELVGAMKEPDLDSAALRFSAAIHMLGRAMDSGEFIPGASFTERLTANSKRAVEVFEEMQDSMRSHLAGLQVDASKLFKALSFPKEVEQRIINLKKGLSDAVEDLRTGLTTNNDSKIFQQFMKDTVNFKQQFAELANSPEFEDGLFLIRAKYAQALNDGIRDAFAESAIEMRKVAEDFLKDGMMDIPRDLASGTGDLSKEFSIFKDRVQEASNANSNFMQTLALQAEGGLINFGEALSSINIRLKETRALIPDIEAQIKVYEQLKSIDFGEKVNADISDTLQQLRGLLLNSKTDVQQLAEALVQLAASLDLTGAAMSRVFADFLSGSLSLRTFRDLFVGVQKSVAEAFASMVLSGGKFLKMLRQLIAEQIAALGTRVLMEGLANVALSLWSSVFGGPNPGQLSAGLKQVAAGTAILAAARAIGGSQASAPKGASAGGASGGGDRQLIIFQPIIQAQTRAISNMNEAVDRLNSNLERMESMTPGDVVAIGAHDASREIGMAVVGAAHSSTRLRTDLLSVVQGEA